MKAVFLMISLMFLASCSHIAQKRQEPVKVSESEIKGLNKEKLNKAFENSKIYKETLNQNLKELVRAAKQGESVAVIYQPRTNICRAMHKEMKKRKIRVSKTSCMSREPASIFEARKNPYLVIDLQD